MVRRGFDLGEGGAASRGERQTRPDRSGGFPQRPEVGDDFLGLSWAGALRNPPPQRGE